MSSGRREVTVCAECGREIVEPERVIFEVTWDCEHCLQRVRGLWRRGRIDESLFRRVALLVSEHRQQDRQAIASEQGDAADFWTLYPRLPQRGLAA